MTHRRDRHAWVHPMGFESAIARLPSFLAYQLCVGWECMHAEGRKAPEGSWEY